jgi:hypothetical protein
MVEWSRMKSNDLGEQVDLIRDVEQCSVISAVNRPEVGNNPPVIPDSQ